MNGYQVGDVPVIGREGLLRLVAVVERLRARQGEEESESSWTTQGRLPQSLARQGLGEEVWAGLPEVNRLLVVRRLAVLAGRALPKAEAAPSPSGEADRS